MNDITWTDIQNQIMDDWLRMLKLRPAFIRSPFYVSPYKNKEENVDPN